MPLLVTIQLDFILQFLLTVCRQGPLSGPPPLYHPSRSPQHSVGQPFRILFSNSRISRCQGCRGKIDHTLDDLVIQHKEHVLFQNPHTGRWEMSHDLRNTYYHAKFSCVTLKHPYFSPAELIMDKELLQPCHLDLLCTEFGLNL